MCNVSIRLLKNIEEDYKLLEKWYQEEEIYSSFDQRKLNYKEIKDYLLVEKNAILWYNIYSLKG